MNTKFRHTVSWDEKNQVVRVTGHGIADLEEAQFLMDETERMASEHGDNLDWMLDISQITKTTAKGRKMLAKASGHPSVHKYALVGASTVMRTVANFISIAAGDANSRHFSTEAEALKWLKEE